MNNYDDRPRSRLVIGSSHARYVGEISDTVTVSISGARFQDLSKYAKSIEGKQILVQKDNIVVIAGGNDLDEYCNKFNRESQDDIIERHLKNLKTLISDIRLGNPYCKIDILSPLPRPARDRKELRLLFNKQAKSFFGQFSSVDYINIEKTFCQPQSQDTDTELFDHKGIHLKIETKHKLIARTCEQLGRRRSNNKGILLLRKKNQI